MLTVQLGADLTGASTPVVAGGWQSVAHLHPRLLFDALTVDSMAANQVRLRFLSRHQVRFVGRVARASEQPKVQRAELSSARSARLGDLKAALASSDGSAAALTGPDTLELSFVAPPQADSTMRDCFLAVDATLGAARATGAAQQGGVRPAIPARFALRQNKPNPFHGITRIRFDLPVGSAVKLEVFDVQGRRIQTLADHFFPAGYQSVQWSPSRDAIGSGPGIYFYRIDTGSWRDRKRMVLVP